MLREWRASRLQTELPKHADVLSLLRLLAEVAHLHAARVARGRSFILDGCAAASLWSTVAPAGRRDRGPLGLPPCLRAASADAGSSRRQDSFQKAFDGRIWPIGSAGGRDSRTNLRAPIHPSDRRGLRRRRLPSSFARRTERLCYMEHARCGCGGRRSDRRVPRPHPSREHRSEDRGCRLLLAPRQP
jgi:hypothetical protein